MVLKDNKSLIKGLSPNPQDSNPRRKIKQLIAITIVLTLTISIILPVPTTTNNNNNDITTTMILRGDKLPTWTSTTGDYVRSVDISADGNYTVAGSRDGKVYFFNKSGHLWDYLMKFDVYSVAVSADGNYIAAGDYPGNVSCFDNSGNNKWNYSTGGEVWSVDISADGNAIAAGGGAWPNYGVFFFSAIGGYSWNRTTDGGITSVSVSADGNYIAAGSYDKKVYFFDNTGFNKWNKTTGGSVYSVAVSSDGSYIAAGSLDGKVYLWNNAGIIQWSSSPGGGVYSVDISSDNNYIAAGTSDDKVFLFDKSGKQLWNYTTNDLVTTVSVSSDGDYIAAGISSSLHDNKVYCFNKTGYLLWDYTTGDRVQSVAISADGYSVAAGSNDNKVYFFESPYIDHPDDITYEPLTTGHNITWHPVDDNPNNYYINQDGNTVKSDFWGGESITINVDGLSAGTSTSGTPYKYVCWVVDGDGKTESDTVYVTVRNDNPTIDNPGDRSYEEGTKGHYITWKASDENPFHYNITRNNDVVNDSSWDGGDIRENIDGLSVGTYYFECTVYDISGNSRSDEVIVTVTEKEEAGFPWQLVVTVVVIVAAVIYFKKRRK